MSSKPSSSDIRSIINKAVQEAVAPLKKEIEGLTTRINELELKIRMENDTVDERLDKLEKDEPVDNDKQIMVVSQQVNMQVARVMQDHVIPQMNELRNAVGFMQREHDGTELVTQYRHRVMGRVDGSQRLLTNSTSKKTDPRTGRVTMDKKDFQNEMFAFTDESY